MKMMSIDEAVAFKISADKVNDQTVDILFTEREVCRCGAEGRVCVREAFKNSEAEYTVRGTHFCLNSECQIIDSDIHLFQGNIPENPLCPVCGRRD